MIRKVLVILALAALAVCYSAPAKADNIHLCDINQYTSCNAGNAIPVYGSLPTQTWVFGTSNTNDTLHIAVLTPNAGTGGSFNSNTNLWAVLGVNPAQVFPNFNSTVSQEQLATGFTAGSFNATSFAVGTWTGSVNVGQSITLPGSLPVGSIFIAYLLDSSGNLVAVSPWSSSLIFVPEPSSLMLLGAGMLGLSFLASRRLQGNG